MSTKITFKSLDELRNAIAQKKRLINAMSELNINQVDSEILADQLKSMNFAIKKKVCMKRYNII